MKRTGELRRTSPLARTGSLSRTKGLNPTSAKGRARTAAYRALRPSVLERDQHMCQRCGSAGPLEVQHKAGRIGGRLLDMDNLVTLCSPCHRWATEHPLQALAEGFSERRVN